MSRRTSFRHKIVLPLSAFEDIHQVKTQGSSPFYEATYRGSPFFLKNVIKNRRFKRVNEYGVFDIQLAVNEWFASLLYSLVFRVPSLPLYLVYNDIGTKQYPVYFIASKVEDLEDCATSTQMCKDLYSNKIPGAVEPILVDAVMANWDVGNQGNIVVRKSTREVLRLDLGGSLLCRALGSPREYVETPYEHRSFFQYPKGKSLFGKITPDQINEAFRILQRAKLDRISSLSKDVLRLLKQEIPVSDFKRAKKVVQEIVSTLKKRIQYYLEHQEEIKEEMVEMI